MSLLILTTWGIYLNPKAGHPRTKFGEKYAVLGHKLAPLLQSNALPDEKEKEFEDLTEEIHLLATNAKKDNLRLNGGSVRIAFSVQNEAAYLLLRQPEIWPNPSQTAAGYWRLQESVLLTAQSTKRAKQKSLTTLSAFKRSHPPQATITEQAGFPVTSPPRPLQLVNYKSGAFTFPAYLSEAARNAAPRSQPALIWLTGGFSNSISEASWEPGPIDNDQSAAVFWHNGLITMYPSLRGGNQNAGSQETFGGEVEDVIAACEFLKKHPAVDPNRIYLGGHSTGGSLALLAAASTDQFRAVFSLGPVDNILGYGEDYCNFDVSDPAQVKMRSPVEWINQINSPTFLVEGYEGNAVSLAGIAYANLNPQVTTHLAFGYDHFSLIRPMSDFIFQTITQDTGEGELLWNRSALFWMNSPQLAIRKLRQTAPQVPVKTTPSRNTQPRTETRSRQSAPNLPRGIQPSGETQKPLPSGIQRN